MDWLLLKRDQGALVRLRARYVVGQYFGAKNKVLDVSAQGASQGVVQGVKCRKEIAR